MKTAFGLVLIAALLIGACAESPKNPLTEHGRAFSELNARLKGPAPP